MRDIIKTALGMGITLGLSDREAFIKQFSEVINQYQQDPEKGQQLAKSMATLLEKTRDNINLENAIHGALGGDHMPDKQSIEDLTKAVKELTDQMKQKDK